MDTKKLSSPGSRAWLWPILLTATIFTLSGASQIATPELSIQLPKDKLAHFLVFGLLATSIMRIRFFSKLGVKGAVFAAAIAIFYGALDEWRQSFTLGRTVEFADWVADSLGAIVSVTIYQIYQPYRKILEARIIPTKKARFLFRRIGP